MLPNSHDFHIRISYLRFVLSGDQAAATIGNGIVRGGTVSSTIGTSGVVFASTDSLITDKLGRVHTFCHATLAGHTFQHELAIARINNMFGSIDANQGDLMLGWDTDQFPTNIYDATLAMYETLKAGGFTTGGLNFDSRPRRASFEADDLFYSHIAGMDTFAKGLRIAYKMFNDGKFEDAISKRYSSYKSSIGKEIVEGRSNFASLEKYALENDQIINIATLHIIVHIHSA